MRGVTIIGNILSARSRQNKRELNFRNEYNLIFYELFEIMLITNVAYNWCNWYNPIRKKNKPLLIINKKKKRLEKYSNVTFFFNVLNYLRWRLTTIQE